MAVPMDADEVAYHQHVVVGTVTIILVFTITSYALRIWARRISSAKLWWDDYVMGVGLFLAIVPGICNYIGLVFGLGKHAENVPPADVEKFLIDFFVLQLGCLITFPIVKIAVLLFYLRLFPNKRFRWAVYAVGVFIIFSLISNVAVVIFQCTPIHGFWQPHIPHTCIDQVTYYIAQGILNLISDILVVFMPIPVLWGLHMPRSRKIGLLIVFSLGGFACAVSLCRIIYLRTVNPHDITWRELIQQGSNVGPGLWSFAEGGIDVVSGNLPLMRPLFKRLGIRFQDSRESDPESSNILEMPSMDSKVRNSQRKTPYQGFNQINYSHATVAPAKAKFKNLDSEIKRPPNRILVETNVESIRH